MWTSANVIDFISGSRKVISRRLEYRKSPLGQGGTGAYAPARHLTVLELPGHTIFAPVSRKQGQKFPLLVWANGFGLTWGLMFGGFLRQIASHGYIVVANGPPNGWGSTNETGQLDAVKWALQGGERPDDIRIHIDTSRIALAGQSKGGIHTYAAAATLRNDPRVKTIGLFNSGLMKPRAKDMDLLTSVTRPIYYFVGDKRDVLYENAKRDWTLIPESTITYFGSLEIGHLGTLYEENGGLFATAAVNWLNVELKVDESSREWLLKPEGPWTVQTKYYPRTTH